MSAARLRIAAAALALGTPAAAFADRVVDYTIDEAVAARDATEQGVALTPLPERGAAHVALQIAPGVDHQVLRVGIACSAWTVQNPISTLLTRFVGAWDKDGAPATVADASTRLLVRIDRAQTLSRCVATGEMKTTCITRVAIAGSTARGDGAAAPFRVEREVATKGIGACAGLARGIGVVSRQAAGALVEQLNQAL